MLPPFTSKGGAHYLRQKKENVKKKRRKRKVKERRKKGETIGIKSNFCYQYYVLKVIFSSKYRKIDWFPK